MSWVGNAIMTLDWISDDHAFCSDECENTDCWRHPSNIKNKDLPHTFAKFKNTELCELPYKEI